MQPADHARDRLVGDVRERLLAEPEERQVRGVPEVEHLEVVLVGLVHHDHQPLEVRDHLVAGGIAAVLEDHRLVLDLGERREVHRLDLLEARGDLLLPLVVDRVPVGVVVAGAALEELGALGELGRVGRHRAHVDVAVDDALVDAVGGRHREDAGVEGAERLPPALALDLVVGVKDAGVVQAVVEPEALLVHLPALLAALVVPVVHLLPALGPLRRGHLVRALEAGGAGHRTSPFNVLTTDCRALRPPAIALRGRRLQTVSGRHCRRRTSPPAVTANSPSWGAPNASSTRRATRSELVDLRPLERAPLAALGRYGALGGPAPGRVAHDLALVDRRVDAGDVAGDLVDDEAVGRDLPAHERLAESPHRLDATTERSPLAGSSVMRRPPSGRRPSAGRTTAIAGPAAAARSRR